MALTREELKAAHNNVMTVMENHIMSMVGCNRTTANLIANEVLNLDMEAERLLSETEEENKREKTFEEVLEEIEKNTTETEEVKISGIIFQHGTDDFGLWEGFVLSEEDENAIQKILSKYDTEGCSVRGTRKEIANEML